MRKEHFYIFHIGRTAYFILLICVVTAFLYCRFMWKEYYHAEYALSLAMIGKVIVVDAGHGGIDPGVVGSDTLEKDINLAISRQLAEILRQGGATVIMTREDDSAYSRSKRKDLATRIELVEKNDPDLFVSIHSNSYPRIRDLCGAQVFYKSGREDSQMLAEYIQQAITDQLQNSDRKALVHKDSLLLDSISSPAVLVEVGFLSNPKEEELLKDNIYQWQMAEAIYRGIVQYFMKEEIPSPKDSANQISSISYTGEKAGLGAMLQGFLRSVF